MACGTRHGGGPLRSGEKPVWPPPLPSRTRRADQPVDRLASRKQAGIAIAVVATLDIEAVYRQHLLGGLPPAIRSAFAALSPPEWTDVCREAIGTQRRLLDAADGVHQSLLRDEPWLLAEILPTMRP
jgi:hypothetical protein